VNDLPAPGATLREVLPGTPEDLDALAATLESNVDGAAAASRGLRQLDSGAWIGEAADAFLSSVGDVLKKLDAAADAFQEAAMALRTYTGVLRDAQADVRRALTVIDQAQTETSVWSTKNTDTLIQNVTAPYPGTTAALSSDDPGEPLRRQADSLITEARARVAAAARHAADGLYTAADHAPDKPGFWSRAAHVASEVAGGAVEATTGMATFAFKLTPAYELIDPEGYIENGVGLVKGLAYGATHPVDFAKAVLDWDTWAKSPGRALGHLLPTVALAVATAGVGSASQGAAAADALESAGARQTAKVVQGTQTAEAAEGAAGTAARTGLRAVVEPDKFRYLFGEVDSGAHNAARSAQNLAQMERLGLRGSEGRSILQAHLDAVARDPTNVARDFSNQYGTFQVRESLFAGPSGAFARFETTWQVMPDGSLRLTTLIPFGGR
jgi:hypothetical protein